MADRKITDLTALAAGSQATGDLLTIVDVSEGAAADKNKKITVESLFKGIPGNVGIGITSPSYKLDVQDVINIKKDGSNLAKLQFNGTSTRIQYSDASGNLEFYTNSAKRGQWGYTGGFVVSSGGLTLSDGNITFSGADRSIINNDANALAFGTNASERMRIDSSGRLLVGASTSPSAGSGQYTKLASVGNTLAANGDGRIMLGRGLAASGMSSSQDIGGVYFTDNTGATFAQVTAAVDGTPGTNDYPGRLVFSTTADGASSPTERMRISSNGSTTLTTNSTDTSVTDVTQLVLKNSSDAANTMAGIRFEASSNSDSDYFIVHKKHGSGTGADLIVQRGSNERLRFIESGGIAFNGDTAAANALDDYEEGTWTANLQSSNDNATRTVGNTTGYYVKVGTMCTAYYYTQGVNCTNAGTGTAVIRGLPFTSANLSNGFAVCTITHATVFASRVQNGYVNPNTTHLVFIGEESTSGVALVPAGTRYLMVSMTYRTE
nr:putative endosialidase [uncultured Mediterranean phage uvMED]